MTTRMKPFSVPFRRRTCRPEPRNCRWTIAPRTGVSLIEMLVVITVAGVMMGLAITTLHMLLGAEHEATRSVRYNSSVARLTHVFRDDIHAARQIELSAVERSQPEVLIVSTADGRQIRYELDAHQALRVETDSTSLPHRESFYFPPHSRLWFERDQEQRLVRLAIDMARPGRAATRGQVEATVQPMRRLAIEAALPHEQKPGAKNDRVDPNAN